MYDSFVIPTTNTIASLIGDDSESITAPHRQWRGNLLTNPIFWQDLLVVTVDEVIERFTVSFMRKRTPTVEEWLIYQGFSQEAIQVIIARLHDMDEGYASIHNALHDFINPPTYCMLQTTNLGSGVRVDNLGDFRILEWEREHITNGKYHERPKTF